jgi:hypothetical protein
MPKRLKANEPLPRRWQLHHGAYFYRVPPGQEHLWDGKRKFRLGSTLGEAHKAFGERIGDDRKALRLANDLLERYEREVVYAEKNPRTRAGKLDAIGKLRTALGHVPLNYPKWPMLFYQYADRRKKPDGSKALTAAHRELEVMSHAFTKAVQWGELQRHPTKNEVRFDGDLGLKARDRYVEDWEIVECLSLEPHRKNGSVRMIQAYIKLKLLTGLSRGDLLRLRLSEHLRD